RGNRQARGARSPGVATRFAFWIGTRGRHERRTLRGPSHCRQGSPRAGNHAGKRRKSTRETSLRARRTRRAEVLACSAADLPSVGAGRISPAGGVAKAALVTRGRFVAYADRDTGAGTAIVTNASRSL